MQAALVAAAMLTLGFAATQKAAAQDGWQCGPSPSDSRLTVEDSILAARYAPIYWFAPGERYFPTIPFFTAFDGIDNNGDDSVDFGDPFEIAPSWQFVNDHYLDRDESDAGTMWRSAVLFRVCDLTADDIADVWRYLQSDEQAWHRFDIGAEILSRLRRKNRINDQGVLERGTEFRVIQYYAFYLRDYGLQGHHYDSELVYVIVPKDEELAREFRVVVGGGHTDRVPNNALVLSGALAARQTGLDARPSILVELGDHSSSPDLPPYGEFSPGLDANWHNHDLWGTRDVQASSGLGAIGPYRAWMTFPRRPEVATRLFPPVVSDTALRGMTQIQLESDQEIARYSLLPVEPFVDVYDRVAETDAVPTPAQVREIESAMARVVELARRGWRNDGSGGAFAPEFAGFDNLDQSQKRAAVTEMKKWLLPVNVVENHYPWETDHYTKAPTRIFKHHLFRPVFTAMDFPLDYLRQFNFAVTWHPSTVLLQAGWDVAAFWLPIRIEGYLSVQGGVYMRCGGLVTPCFGATSPAFSVVHTAHYNRLLSWYIRFSWIPRKGEVDGRPDQSDWLAGGGLALTPSKVVRVRLGLVTDLRHTSPLLGSTVFEAQLVIHPFHRRGVPTEFDPRLVRSER